MSSIPAKITETTVAKFTDPSSAFHFISKRHRETLMVKVGARELTDVPVSQLRGKIFMLESKLYEGKPDTTRVYWLYTETDFKVVYYDSVGKTLQTRDLVGPRDTTQAELEETIDKDIVESFPLPETYVMDAIESQIRNTTIVCTITKRFFQQLSIYNEELEIEKEKGTITIVNPLLLIEMGIGSEVNQGVNSNFAKLLTITPDFFKQARLNLEGSSVSAGVLDSQKKCEKLSTLIVHQQRLLHDVTPQKYQWYAVIDSVKEKKNVSERVLFKNLETSHTNEIRLTLDYEDEKWNLTTQVLERRR